MRGGKWSSLKAEFAKVVRERDESRVEAERLRDAARVRRANLSAWLRRGGPCVDDSGIIYGPYQDACEIIAEAIDRAEDDGA